MKKAGYDILKLKAGVRINPTKAGKSIDVPNLGGGNIPSGIMSLTPFGAGEVSGNNFIDGGYYGYDNNFSLSDPAHVVVFLGGDGTTGNGSSNGGTPAQLLIQSLGQALNSGGYTDWVCNGDFIVFMLIHTTIYQFYNDDDALLSVQHAANKFNCIGGAPWLWLSSRGGVAGSNIYDNGNKAEVLGSFHGAAELPNVVTDLTGHKLKYFSGENDGQVGFVTNNARATNINNGSTGNPVEVYSLPGIAHDVRTWGDPFGPNRNDVNEGALSWLQQVT